MKKFKFGPLILALSISFVFTGSMLYYNNLKSANEQKIKVVVAAQDIKENTVISENQLEVKNISKIDVVSGYKSNKKDIIGKISKDNIFKNQQISTMNIVQSGDKDKLSLNIPKGHRAITVKVDMVSGVGGHIKIGDYIDVIAYIQPPETINKEVRVIFQSIEVIDVNSNNDSSGENTYITLCMVPEDAEKLFLMGEISKIKFMLKNPTYKQTEIISNIKFDDPRGGGQ